MGKLQLEQFWETYKRWPVPPELWDGQWAGAPCIIVGGGASVPKDMGKKLWEWHAHGGVSIGINAAYTMCPVIAHMGSLPYLEEVKQFIPDLPAIFTVMSYVIHHDQDPRGCAVLNTADAGSIPWGMRLRDGIYPHNNSGVNALNLADILMANPIYLVGFDMSPGCWHSGYTHEREPTKAAQYLEYKKSFRLAAECVGAKVYNVNPKDTLPFFERIDIDELTRRHLP